MGYRLRLEGGGAQGGGGVTVPDADHDLLADAIVRAAGTVRLLRRLVDPDREARFGVDEVPQVLHEIADLEAGLAPAEREPVAGALDRVAGLFATARTRCLGVAGRGES